MKLILPDRQIPVRILRGPFRGARILMNPRHSMRKMFGLYEHELNHWLEMALQRVSRVIDVGANDGYFSFGCAAAFRRLGKAGEIISIEAQQRHVLALKESIGFQQNDNQFTIIHAYAGNQDKPGFITLDALKAGEKKHSLIKIDVEGAEVDVIDGGRSWMNPSNLYVIEVHNDRCLTQLQTVFVEHGLRLIQVNQRPLPVLGRETRDVKNWWLVSDLAQYD